MTKSIGPEMLAAAAEKHGAGKSGGKMRVPSLQELVTKPGAVIGLLKAIMNFLKLRFPAFLGMNVLYSLALFSKSAFRASHRAHGLILARSPALHLLVLP